MRAREQAGLTDQRYRSLVEQVPAVSYVAEWAPDAPFAYVSPQIEALLGVPAERWVEDRGLWAAHIHPEDRAKVLEEELRTFEEETTFDREFRMLATDGSVIWVWERDTIIRDATGAPTHTEGVIVDISAMKLADMRLRLTEAALREEHDLAQHYLDVAGTILLVLEPGGVVSLLNRHGRELLGYEEGELIGADWFATVVPAELRDSRRANLQATISGQRDAVTYHQGDVLTRAGERRTIAWRNTLLCDEEGRVLGTLSSGEDITERLEAEDEIRRLAYFDDLTGLPNRPQFERELRRCVSRSRRSGRTAALLFVDLDDFKLVNDSFGHADGDRLLRKVAARLRGVEGDGLLARHGGDEFLLLLHNLGDQPEAEARTVAAEVAARLAEPFQVAGAQFHVGASVGISLFPHDAESAVSLMQHADMAMYESKRLRSGGATVYSRVSHDPLERLSLSSRLRRAVAEDELVVHYQPIVEVDGGRMVAMEALLRWEDPERGLVQPDQFIPAAEEMGLLGPIGDWVIGAIGRDVLAWRDEGLAPHISFNVSPHQLQRREFAMELREQLSELELEPSWLTMELTESATLREPERIGRILRELSDAGMRLAIDDFGAGWSSLARLRILPVDMLKIDRSFLQEIPEDPEASAIVRAVVGLSDALGMTTVAEGVETPVQASFLAAQRCELAQGRQFGAPAPAPEAGERLREAARIEAPAERGR